MKKALSLFLTLAMVLSMLGTSVLASDYDDVSGHWAENAIAHWSGYGVVSGRGDGSFAPNANMTRAEMAQLYVNLLGLTEKADIRNFTDVPADAWYADAVAKCVAAGILNGTSGSTLSPLGTVTREQMFVSFGRAMGVQPAEATDSSLEDLGEVSGWAEGMVNALLEAGYITGMENNTLQPLANINRASVMSLMDKTVTVYANEPGTTVETEGDGGLVLVVSDGVTVTGTVGDVVIAQGAAEGTVTLKDATVSGTVTVAAAQSQVTVSGNSQVENLVVNETAQRAEVSVAKDAAVGTVTTAASDSTLAVAGKVENVAVTETASNATVNTEKGAQIENVTTSGTDTTVSGSGTVNKVEAAEGSTGATVTTPGTTVENNGSGSVSTGSGTVDAGQSGTTGGTSGGSSSGGSSGGSSHSHSYTDGICSCGSYDPTWAQVSSAEDWNAAVEAGKNIIVTEGFTAAAQLKVTRGITVNGNYKTITAGIWEDPNEAKGDASLVLINAADGAVVLKNITLSSAKDIGNDYGHGLNVFLSPDVTLNNVTLSGNDGAGMVVNGSTVTATGLHTSGNGWGGVNVDRGSGVTAETTFTFDAASTFHDGEGKPAVYSDSGNVTVNAPANWTSKDVDGITIWVKLFDGSGTEQDPYQIADAEQLKAAFAAGGVYSFRNDITLDEAVTVSGTTLVLDLNGNTLHYTAAQKDGKILVANGADLTVENGTIHMPNAPYYGFYVTDSAALTLFHITADSNDCLVFGAGQETVVIRECDLTTSYPIYHNGSTSPASLTILDSTINGGVYVSNTSDPDREKQTLVIDRSTIIGPTAVEFKHTNATITNSILVGTETPTGSGTNNNGTCTSGYAVAVTTNSADDLVTGNVTIRNCQAYSGEISETENGYYFVYKVADGFSVTIDDVLVDDYNSYGDATN